MTQTIATKILNRHGLNISVLAEIPENPKGLLFILHGFTGCKDELHLAKIAETAIENSLVSVRFDTTHTFGESDGKLELATVGTYLDDLTDVINWAATHDWYVEPFVLVAHSFGGMVILEYTNANRDKVKAIAPIASIVSGELSYAVFESKDPEAFKQWKETGWASRSARGQTDRLPWSHLENRLLYNPFDYAGSLTLPAFMLVGTKDTSTPLAHQQLLFDALGSQPKEIHFIEDARHDLSKPHELVILKSRFSAWLAKIL